MLSFCFVDPFAADLKFSTIRALARFKVDFLVLLMLGRDVRTNFNRYFEDSSNTRIAELIDSPGWRKDFVASGESVVRFVLRRFDEAMGSLDYKSSQAELTHQVKIAGRTCSFTRSCSTAGTSLPAPSGGKRSNERIRNSAFISEGEVVRG